MHLRCLINTAIESFIRQFSWKKNHTQTNDKLHIYILPGNSDWLMTGIRMYTEIVEVCICCRRGIARLWFFNWKKARVTISLFETSLEYTVTRTNKLKYSFTVEQNKRQLNLTPTNLTESDRFKLRLSCKVHSYRILFSLSVELNECSCISFSVCVCVHACGVCACMRVCERETIVYVPLNGRRSLLSTV